jgi:hypothetical protein
MKQIILLTNKQSVSNIYYIRFIKHGYNIAAGQQPSINDNVLENLLDALNKEFDLFILINCDQIFEPIDIVNIAKICLNNQLPFALINNARTLDKQTIKFIKKTWPRFYYLPCNQSFEKHLNTIKQILTWRNYINLRIISPLQKTLKILS